MDADLMITIAFCLYVLVASFAVWACVTTTIRDDNHPKQADAKRVRQPRNEAMAL
jgi:hypothetical protein